MARLDFYAPPRLEILEDRETPAALAGTETFDAVVPPMLPAGWSVWSSDGSTSIAVTAGSGTKITDGVVSQGTSKTNALAWNTQAVDPNTAVSVSVLANSLVPAMVFARGQDLGTSTPSYLAAVVTRGLSVQLWQVTNGQVTILGSLQSPSSSYFSGQWVTVSLVPNGTTASITVQRQDTGQYLNSQGTWQTASATALSDNVAAATGLVGLGRAAQYAGNIQFDNFTVTPPPAPPAPAAPPTVTQDFNNVMVGTIPNGWTSWSPSPTAALQATRPRVGVPTINFASNSPTLSNAAARSWADADLGANVDVSASVYLDTLISAQVFARGTNLATSTPTYYAVTITRGLQASLVKVQNGVTTTLATLKSTAYISGQWVNVHLIVDGDHLQVTITRQDTGQYLQTNGTWGTAPEFVMDLRDSSITGDGSEGVARAASFAGTVTFDDFYARSLGADAPPTVSATVTNSTMNGSGYMGPLIFQASATAGTGLITSVQFQIDGSSPYVGLPTSSTWVLDTTSIVNGAHTLTVTVFDSLGHTAIANLAFNVNNPPVDPTPTPIAPQHLPNIRIAELAYSGTPIGSFEQNLLQNDVDLVIPNPSLLATINSVAPNTPQLIYTNLSNLYGSLLTSWLNYAYTNGINPEAAFYHVTTPTPFTGSSPSSQPVDWFWSILQSSASGGAITDATSSARTSTTSWGAAGQTTALGYTDPFREIDINVSQTAASGFSGVWQYATVNAQGQTVWKTLSLISDSTAGFTKTGAGTITFDPPTDWSPTAATPGATMYYYIRFLSTNGTANQAPQSVSILGRDYVNANGGQSGVIPVFDYAADTNHDGYLDDAEYANRAPGDNARFVYETRLIYPSYGQERLVTNPSNPAVAAWAASYQMQTLQSQPLADGIFIDNSSGKLPFSNIPVLESTTNYTTAYAAMVNTVNLAITPDWVMTNTTAGGTAANAVAAASSATFEESLLRPLTTNWAEFGDVANTVAGLLSVPGSPYVILDSTADGGSPTDPRTQIATLAYYYLLADPTQTFLMFYGGSSPSTSWTQHWSQAATVNIGTPTGSFTTIATGVDPTNSALTYKVFARQYTDGLVLYKPLSYTLGQGEGTTANATATLVQLPGSYYVVNADGTMMPAVTSIMLRNGEGAVLVKA